jgi:hypothetical protein
MDEWYVDSKIRHDTGFSASTKVQKYKHDTKNKIITTNISDLIADLEKIKEKYGNLDVVYWDQSSACMFDNPKAVMHVEIPSNHLYIGGFHHNASNYQEFE